jgi:hypothetical protein
MTTWTQINTGAISSTSHDFAAYANLVFAEGTFADGAINEGWNTINTTQSANWATISTGVNSNAYDFAVFSGPTFAEGAFADGTLNDPWITINTG